MSRTPDGPGPFPLERQDASGGASAGLREWAMTRPARHRAIGARRAAACRRLPMWASKEVVERGGSQVAAEMGVSFRTWKRWRATVRGAPEADWPYLLTPRWSGRTSRKKTSAEAWEFFRSLYLVRRQPTVADCWRRTCEAAAEHAWGRPPSVWVFRRRIKTEISAREWTLKRHGPEALARLFPSQRRDRRGFQAGEAAVADGLKFDRLWIKWEDGEILNTVTGWFWQDLATGLITAHRVAKTETADLFRRSVVDLCDVAKPDQVWVDNTRAAANKAMTAGAAHRWRGKAMPDDPPGLLAQIGIEVHFTNPDKVFGSPGAKPVERAFGIGGIHEAVATHPRFRDRGQSRKTAIPIGEFVKVLAEEVERFNTRPGRRTAACGGRLSFRQVWDRAAAAGAPLGRLTEEQRELLARVPETVLADRRTGEIRLKAGRGPLGRRRYWHEDLTDWCGGKVVAWYDPDDFGAAIAVATLDGRHICRAGPLEDVGFADKEAAGEWGKNKRRFVTATKAAAAAQERMTAAEVASLYPSPKPTPPPPEPGVVKGTFRRTAELKGGEAAEATGTDGAPSSLGDRADALRDALEARLAAAALAPTDGEWDD